MIENLFSAKKNGWRICQYGLGQIGCGIGKDVLACLDIAPDYYCDKNSKRLEEFSCRDEQKICINDLLVCRQDLLIILCIGIEQEQAAFNQFIQNENLHIVTWSELRTSDLVLSKFFEVSEFPQKKNIAVFTCITGNYDDPLPLKVRENICDYFLISDVPGDVSVPNESDYIRIAASSVVPKQYNTPKSINRYCKMHGYEIFADYKYSIYIDGNLRIIGAMSDYIDMIGSCGLAFHKHPFAIDSYSEAFMLSYNGRISVKDAKWIGNYLVANRIPRRTLYLDCNVIACDRDNPIARKILTEWSDEYTKGVVKRDQFYMASVLWKNGITEKQMGIMPGDVRNDGYVIREKMHQGIQND